VAFGVTGGGQTMVIVGLTTVFLGLIVSSIRAASGDSAAGELTLSG
jgi:hypothetical protein